MGAEMASWPEPLVTECWGNERCWQRFAMLLQMGMYSGLVPDSFAPMEKHMKRSLVVILALLATMVLAGIGQAQELPADAQITGVIGRPQTYRLSCESRSATDLAAYWGIDVSETAFFESLPASDNPNVGFVGSVHGAWGNTPPVGYGVHAPPIAEALRAKGLDARAVTGLSWDELRGEIAGGRPAIVWVIGSVWAGTAQSYLASDGATVTVAPFEHTMLLVGYTPDTVTLIDAADGLSKVYRVQDFLTSWGVLGNMAVLAASGGASSEAAAAPQADLSAASPAPVAVQTYVVQPGDRLASVAAAFGLDWPELAQLNGIGWPYTIYVGQVLRLQAETAAATETSPATGVHVVQAGEYLAGIAARYGLDWLSLARMNGLAPPYIVYVGQQLRVPEPGADLEQTAAADAPSPGGTTYVVQPGETLSQIAARFGVDWHTLAALNGIVFPDQIFAYQTLLVP
jgi:LysM repeat protein